MTKASAPRKESESPAKQAPSSVSSAKKRKSLVVVEDAPASPPKLATVAKDAPGKAKEKAKAKQVDEQVTSLPKSSTKGKGKPQAAATVEDENSSDSDDAAPAPQKVAKTSSKGKDSASVSKKVAKAAAQQATSTAKSKTSTSASLDEGAGPSDEPAPAPTQKKPRGVLKPSSATKGQRAPAIVSSKKTETPAEEDADSSEDEDVYLKGFSSGSDSSDDNMEGGDAPALDVSKLPPIARDDASVKRKLDRAKKIATAERGVLYLGRIPHGFYEDEMRAYFSQFGDITRLRLSRNKKTGASKHYAFIEFASAPVAQIVQETMDNYLLMGHILQCKRIPKEEVHPQLWVGANRKWRVVPRDRIARVKHNKKRTEDETARAEARLLERQDERKRKLQAAGIDYDFEEVAYVRKKPALGLGVLAA